MADTRIRDLDRLSSVGDTDVAVFDSADNTYGITFANLVKCIKSTLFPVGSVIFSTTLNTQAKVISQYGGSSWTQIKDVFLLAAGDSYSAGTTGGSANAVNVSHSHAVNGSGGVSVGASNLPDSVVKDISSSQPQVSYASGSNTINPVTGIITQLDRENHAHTLDLSSVASGLSIENTGESGVGKNMPPYLAVYAWKRTA